MTHNKVTALSILFIALTGAIIFAASLFVPQIASLILIALAFVSIMSLSRSVERVLMRFKPKRDNRHGQIKKLSRRVPREAAEVMVDAVNRVWRQ